MPILAAPGSCPTTRPQSSPTRRWLRPARAEAETEPTLAVPATSVKPRAAIEPVGVGLVGELFPQPTAASPNMTHRPRLTGVSLDERGNRICALRSEGDDLQPERLEDSPWKATFGGKSGHGRRPTFARLDTLGARPKCVPVCSVQRLLESKIRTISSLSANLTRAAQCRVVASGRLARRRVGRAGVFTAIDPSTAVTIAGHATTVVDLR